MSLFLVHPPSAQIPKAQELSAGTPYPASTGESVECEPKESLEGLWEGEKNNEMNYVASENSME